MMHINWALVVGLFCVAAACVIAYLMTAPAEADISQILMRLNKVV